MKGQHKLVFLDLILNLPGYVEWIYFVLHGCLLYPVYPSYCYSMLGSVYAEIVGHQRTVVSQQLSACCYDADQSPYGVQTICWWDLLEACGIRGHRCSEDGDLLGILHQRWCHTGCLKCLHLWINSTNDKAHFICTLTIMSLYGCMMTY